MIALGVVRCDVKYRIIAVYRPPYCNEHAQSTMTDILRYSYILSTTLS